MASIRQGEIYWANLPSPIGSGPGYRRPVIVIQNDAVNVSAIRSALVSPLTTNLRLALAPGNELFPAGEANLPETSVANVLQISAIDQALLDEYIGQISRERLMALIDGLLARVRPTP